MKAYKSAAISAAKGFQLGTLLNPFALTTDSEDGRIEALYTDSEDGIPELILIDTEDR